MSSFKYREQEGNTGPIWGLVLVGMGSTFGKGVREWIWWKYVLMYENGKMRPVETVPGKGKEV
jgi:hypothetical protein